MEKKAHYFIKYLIIGLPIVLVALSLLSYNSQYTSVLNDVNKLCFSLRDNSAFSWYDTILTQLNINVDNDIGYILSTMPLYIMLVYMADLVLDVLCFLPKLFHKWLYNWSDKV